MSKVTENNSNAPGKDATANHQPTTLTSPPDAKPKKSKAPLIVVAILVIAAVAFGYKTYSFNQSHSETDDAQLVADSTSVSPQISGTVEQVLVNDNQLVKKGDLLVVIDDRSLQASLSEAQANLDAAIAQAQGAGVSVALTQDTGNAQITQAQGVIQQAKAGIASAHSDVAKAGAGVASAVANEGSALATVRSAQSGVSNALAALKKAQAALKGSQAVVATAEAQVKVADANVATAQANADVATKDAARYQNLVSQGAVSQQEADQKQAAADAANATLEGAKQSAAAARAGLAQRVADVASAQSGVTQAESAVQQARDNVNVTRSQRTASSAAYRSAIAQQSAAEEEVRTAQARAQQAEGQLQQAQTVGTSVDVSKTARLQAQAKVEQARAAVAEAKLQLSYTKIYAPRDGRVTKKNVDIGNQVSPGSPLLTLVDESNIWVVANFKETQMPGITPGKKAEIEIDAVSHYTFKGTVQSIQAGTGAAFTLLPPDNATGNFTKVVQRVPVKITFDPGQQDMNQLRSGLSATATVTTKDGD